MKLAGKVVRLTQPFPPFYRKYSPPRHTQFRCYSRKKPPEEKTWTEIGEEAVEVAKSVVGKIVEAGQNVVKGATEQTEVKKQRKDESSLSQPSSLFGGLLGRTIGGLMGGALKALSEQMVESQLETRNLYETAALRVQQNEELTKNLGPVSCGSPFSQSSSTQSINGVTSKRTTLVFPVSGPGGSGEVQVNAQEGPNQPQDIQITVRLSTGRVVRVDGKSEGGRTIDVEWKDV